MQNRHRGIRPVHLENAGPSCRQNWLLDWNLGRIASANFRQNEDWFMHPHFIWKWLALASLSAWLCSALSAQSQDVAEAARQAKLKKQQSAPGSAKPVAKSKTCTQETAQPTESARVHLLS